MKEEGVQKCAVKALLRRHVGTRYKVQGTGCSRQPFDPFDKTCRRGVRLRLTRSPQVESLRASKLKAGRLRASGHMAMGTRLR